MPSPLLSQRSQSSPSSQRRYCTGQGSFTPSCAAMRATCDWVILGSMTSARTGLPDSDIRKYEMIVMPKNMGIACTRRRKIYRDIQTTLLALAASYQYADMNIRTG